MKKKQKLKCSKCKKKVNYSEKVCPNCGADLKKQKRIGLIALLVFVFIIAIIVIVVPKDNLGQISKIENNMNVSNEKARTINNIFSSIGLDDVLSVEYDVAFDNDEGEGSKGYRVGYAKNSDNAELKLIVQLDKEGNVIFIKYVMGDYLYKDNKALGNIKDNLLTTNEMSDYQLFAEKEIKKLLKSPSTAKFPAISEYKFSKTNGEVTLQSYVDSENSYGANIRAEFQFKFDKDKNVTSLIFEGKEYIK